jgi:Lrp/AsnC family transcriptional regulator, leucine-responsive regulatory protein
MTSLDTKTGAILRALLRDARQSMRVLGAAVGLSPPAVTERVRRLEDLGVIRGYKPLLDAARIGWPVQAIVSVTARDGHCDRVLAVLRELPAVTAVYDIAGETDYIAHVVARDLADLQAVTARIAGFGAVSTQVILKIEFERDLPLAAADRPRESILC